MGSAKLRRLPGLPDDAAVIFLAVACCLLIVTSSASGATYPRWIRLAGLVSCRRTGPILRQRLWLRFAGAKWRYGCAVGLGQQGLAVYTGSFVSATINMRRLSL